jgi:hypothetical protein
LKQTLKIGAMVLVVAAMVTTGIAVAQSGDHSSVFAAAGDETSATDESTAADDAPLRSRILEWLAPLVEDDTITGEQAEAVADTLAGHLPRLRPGVGRALVAVQEAADFLGMTGRELVEALRDGATLADLAGDDTQALIDHLVGVAEEHLDEAVADGRITEDEKAERLAEATEHITALVNGDLERPLLGEGPGPGMGRGPGMGNGPCRDDDADSGLGDLGA